ncbi:IclR family transcriptional regulator [Novosphingobium sp. SG720]|uniref:IclR family transcriptional regulator n=1 Tax=Novosphingobium sp. SG720 TaxID=2586998 RepID=UPI001446D3F5|nr:IclR family transcriptional regulator [Novosphingobium sp. SG720]NKJ41354.1 IclR family acetate operon transcriptional repressor [Novosphingobium sp. SG720]
MASAPSAPASAKTGPVKSALRTLDVIEFVVAHAGGVVAQDVAQALGIPVSSLSYLLATLVERQYLARDGRRYLPGPGLERLRVAPAALPLADRVAPLVRALKAELNETASFMVRVGWDVEAVVTEASDQTLRYAIEPGARRPLHCLAAGKVILAYLSEADLHRYFAESTRTAMTEHTRVRDEDLRADLTRIRAEGIATACHEATLGICGTAVPVRVGGQMVGVLSVAVPEVRFDAALAARVRSALKRAAGAVG